MATAYSQIELVKMLLSKKKKDEAVFELHRILKNPESDAKELYEAGLIYHELGYLDKAIHSFERACQMDPSLTDASIALSVVLNDLGQYDKARDVFERAERRAETDNQTAEVSSLPASKMFASKHNEIGTMYLSFHRYVEAKIEFEKAKRLDSTQPQFAVNLSKALFKLGRTSKAKDVLLACVKEHPKYVPVRVNLGLLFYSEGNLVEAQRAWKKALDIDPNNQEASRCLSMVQ